MTALRRRRASGERGAVLVEFVVIVPVLILVAVGLLEFGMAWRSNLTATNATRAGVRVGASAGDNRYADYQILQSLDAALESIPDSAIQYIVIYSSDGPDGEPSAQCKAGSSSPASGRECNVYTAAQMNTLVPADFLGTTSCTGTSPDTAYCPVTDRETDLAVGPDFLGVYIKFDHAMVTNLFSTSLTITDRAVMRVEPDLALSNPIAPPPAPVAPAPIGP